MKVLSDEIEVRYYEDEFGHHPFAKFFKRVKGMAAAKVTGAITRLRAGNTGDSKSVGKGVSELRACPEITVTTFCHTYFWTDPKD